MSTYVEIYKIVIIGALSLLGLEILVSYLVGALFYRKFLDFYRNRFFFCTIVRSEGTGLVPYHRLEDVTLALFELIRDHLQIRKWRNT